MKIEQNPRWSPDDTVEVLKSFYCLYHAEVLGYQPRFFPTLDKSWFIEQLEAFDWYTNFNGCRDKALEREPTKKKVTTTTRKKSTSSFVDERNI